MVIPIIIGMLRKEARRVGKWRTNQNHPNYSIVKKQSEYWEESCRLEETCCLLDSPGKDHQLNGGARGVMVIVIGNGHGDASSNPGRGWLHFTKH